MANIAAMLTSSNQFWCSPQIVADALYELYDGPPDFDPAGSPDGLIQPRLQYVQPRSVPREAAAAEKRLKRMLTVDERRFVCDEVWSFNRRCRADYSIRFHDSLKDDVWSPYPLSVDPDFTSFMNQPYDRNNEFMERMVATRKVHQRCHFVTLIAARPSANWFQNYVFGAADAILFYNKRLKMLGGKYSAPFDSVSTYHGSNVDGFVKAFGHLGSLVI